MIKVSVVIPVYNPGPGIEKCIQTLQNQTLKDIELIFVDDRGTDDAMDRVVTAAKADTRIRILINPQNIGAGLSRNRGIEAAQGEYLSFVDPDDYVAEDFLERLYAKAAETGADIVKGEKAFVDIHGNIDSSPMNNLLNDRIRNGLANGRPLYCMFSYEHTTAIYKRALVASAGAQYGTSSVDEDTTFLLKISYASKKFEQVQNAIYYICRRSASAVHDFSAKRLEGLIDSLLEQMDFLIPRFSETREYMSLIVAAIRARLNALDTAEFVFNMHSETAGFRAQMRNYLSEVPFIHQLEAEYLPIKALIECDVNLGIAPYGQRWRDVSSEEYEGIATRWVDFLIAHPEWSDEAQDILRKVFEDAISHVSQESVKERQKLEGRLRTAAHKLPDRATLTKDYATMKLFIDFGINLFELRETRLGRIIKGILARARSHHKKV